MMSSWNFRERTERDWVTYQAVALAILLIPITATLARGQLSVTLSLMTHVPADDPAQVQPVEDPARDPGLQHPAAAQSSTASTPNSPPESAAGQPAAEELDAEASAGRYQNQSKPANAKAEGVDSTLEPKSTSEQKPSVDEGTSIPQPPVETQLSVEPLVSLLPTDRPAWIGNEMDLKSVTHRFVVSSIPTASESDVDSNLDSCLEAAARSYVCRLLNDDRAGEVLSNQLSSAFVRTNLLDDRTVYMAELSTTGGVMFQKWVMVEVTKEQQEQIRTWYSEQIQRRRMIPLAIGFAGLVTLVGMGNLFLRRSASRARQSSVTNLVGGNSVGSCCGRRGGWGYAFAIMVAVFVAVLVGTVGT